MSGIDVDATELAGLADDLERAPAAAAKAVRGVVAKGALNIKRDAQGRVSGLAHAPAYPRAITYDTTATDTEIAAEIGPDKTRTQGALGNILEYGTVKNAPIPHLGPALTAEEPRFVQALEGLAGEGVERP